MKMKRINGRKLKKLLKKTEELNVKMFNLLKVGKKVTYFNTTINDKKEMIIKGFKYHESCMRDGCVFYECEYKVVSGMFKDMIKIFMLSDANVIKNCWNTHKIIKCD